MGYHQHPAFCVIEHRWDFDASNGIDFDHPNAIGPVVTNFFGRLGTNTATLQVRDNATPQLNDTLDLTVRVTIPPYPPTADAGGPYFVIVGEDLHLDGSGSFDVDAASGDYIQSYDWEIDLAPPLDFSDGVTGQVATVVGGFPTVRKTQVGLRVKDTTSRLVPGAADLTKDDWADVFVSDRVITDLRGRPKDHQIQLTWTKAGDYSVVKRSQVGPDRGFAEVGRIESTYATFLDTNVEFNVEYHYRFFAYLKGRSDPLGLSDAEFVVSPPRSFDEHAPYFDAMPPRLVTVGALYQPKSGS